MNEPQAQITFAVAFVDSADVVAWQIEASREERELITRTLCNLVDLGHIASFSIRSSYSITPGEFLDRLRSRLGNATVDACSAALWRREFIAPAFLLPVWPFDHEVGGALASTAQFRGLDLELIATPSSDEEMGAYLPDRAGRWLIHARPMF